MVAQHERTHIEWLEMGERWEGTKERPSFVTNIHMYYNACATWACFRTRDFRGFAEFGDGKKQGQTPESGIPPSFRATMRYSKVWLGLWPQFSKLIGQLGRVPLFGARRPTLAVHPVLVIPKPKSAVAYIHRHSTRALHMMRKA